MCLVSVGDALLNSSVTDIRKANANMADGEGKVIESDTCRLSLKKDVAFACPLLSSFAGLRGDSLH